MDSTKTALLCVIAILAIGLCVTSYMAFGEKSTPGGDGDEPLEEVPLVDTWEWRVGYSVSSIDMDKVEKVTSGPSIKIVNKYGKLMQIVENDVVNLATMTRSNVFICLQHDDVYTADNYFFAVTNDLLLRYSNAWDTPSFTSFAKISVYVRQGATVSDSDIDKYLTCPDICKSYVQDSVKSTNDSHNLASTTTTISDLGYGLIYLSENITLLSGEKKEVRCIGFVYPLNNDGEVGGVYTQNPNDIPRELGSSIEFICGNDYFYTTSIIYDENGAYAVYTGNENEAEAPDIEGLDLVCNEGNVTLTKTVVSKNLNINFSIHISEQKGCLFSGYSSLNGEKLYDIIGTVKKGSDNNLIIEYGCIDSKGADDYFIYVGNQNDGFEGAGGNSYGDNPIVISSKLVVEKKN